MIYTKPLYRSLDLHKTSFHIAEFNDIEDDTNAFSKTGALTIKSSSGSSGGLAAAFGIRREDSLDSDEFPHESSCCDSHHHDNSGDSSSEEGLDENQRDLVQKTTETLKLKSDNQSKMDKQEELDQKKAGSKKSKELRLTTDKVNEIEVLKNSVSEWIDSVQDTHPVPENNFEAGTEAVEEGDKDLAIKPEYQPKHKQSKTKQQTFPANNLPQGHLPDQLVPHQDPNLVLSSDLIEQVANNVKNYDPRPAKEFLHQNAVADHSVVPASALNLIKTATDGYGAHLESNQSSRVQPPPGFVGPVNSYPMVSHQIAPVAGVGMYQQGNQAGTHSTFAPMGQEAQKDMIPSNTVMEKMVNNTLIYFHLSNMLTTSYAYVPHKYFSIKDFAYFFIESVVLFKK